MFKNLLIRIFSLSICAFYAGNNLTYASGCNSVLSLHSDATLQTCIDNSGDSSTNLEVASMLSPQSTHPHFHLPPSWLAFPFILLLLMIATGPLLYESFWHKHYPKISILLSGLVMSYYLFVLGNYIKPLANRIMMYI